METSNSQAGMDLLSRFHYKYRSCELLCTSCTYPFHWDPKNWCSQDQIHQFCSSASEESRLSLEKQKWPVKQSRPCHQTFLHLLSYMHCTCKFKTNLEQKTDISISIKVEKPEKRAKFDRPSGAHVHAKRENTMKNTIHTHLLYPTSLL